MLIEVEYEGKRFSFNPISQFKSVSLDLWYVYETESDKCLFNYLDECSKQYHLINLFPIPAEVTELAISELTKVITVGHCNTLISRTQNSAS
ncbi:hypothetical protein DZF79_28725 [Vibrio parahaemolyticus]|nr:hypothetical protein [Vibrio parahaemolyticus]